MVKPFRWNGNGFGMGSKIRSVFIFANRERLAKNAKIKLLRKISAYTIYSSSTDTCRICMYPRSVLDEGSYFQWRDNSSIEQRISSHLRYVRQLLMV